MLARIFFFLCVGATLTSCLDTAVSLRAPHVVPSPEEWVVETPATSDVYYGLQLRANESDSLEDLETLPGLVVEAVDPGSPAANVGLRDGDVILSADGKETNDEDSFRLASAEAASSSLTLRVRRDTVVFESKIEGVVAVEAATREVARSDPVRLRATFESVSVSVADAVRRGARVMELAEESPLALAGIEVGDTVVGFDGVELASAQDLITRALEQHEEGDDVLLSVLPATEREVSDVEVTLWESPSYVRDLAAYPLFHYRHEPESEATEFSILDLWIISLYSYRRDGAEAEHSILRFLRFSSGRGELQSAEEEALP